MATRVGDSYKAIANSCPYRLSSPARSLPLRPGNAPVLPTTYGKVKVQSGLAIMPASSTAIAARHPQSAEEISHYIEPDLAHEQTTLLPKANDGDNTFEKRKYQFAYFLVFALVLVIGAGIIDIPSLEIYRYIICQKYYADSGNYDLINLVARFDGTVDSRCSIDPISRSLAQFTGTVDFLQSLVALCVVLFYGRLADRYGRKVPLYIAVVGLLFYYIWNLLVVVKASVWSINMILVGSIVSGVTGASPVLRMILYTMICDMFGEADRLVALSIFMAVILVGGSLAPAIGSGLLSVGLLWPLYAGSGTIAASLIFLLFLPETHPSLGKGEAFKSRSRDVSQLTNDEDLHAQQDDTPKSFGRTFYEGIVGSVAALKIFGRGGNFVAIAVLAFINGLTVSSGRIIPQFLNHSIKWSMVKVGYLIAGMSAGRVFILLVVLPVFTKFMLKRMSNRRLDVLIIKISLVADLCVNVTYGVMTSAVPLFFIVPVQTIGAPLTASIKVVISNLVEPDEIGSVFAAFSVVEGLSDMIGSPVFALLYSATLAVHAGSVFLVVAALFVVALVAASLIRTDRFVVATA